MWPHGPGLIPNFDWISGPHSETFPDTRWTNLGVRSHVCQESNLKPQASRVNHQSSSLKHQVSSIKHRAPSIEHQAFCHYPWQDIYVYPGPALQLSEIL